jgi:hypothetical protein
MLVVGSASSGLAEVSLRTWKWFLPDGFNAVATNDGVTYAVGANGKVARLDAR